MEHTDFKHQALPRSTSAALVDTLRDAVARGVLPPGTPLRQDQLAAQFRVSHIPVREALRQLVSEGLAVLVPNKGVVVSDLSIAEVTELTDYRCVLERELARWAVPKLTEVDFEQAARILEGLDRTSNLNDILRLNAEFHATIFRRAERPFFLKAVETARVNLARYWRLAWLELGHKAQSQFEHRRILRLCKQHKAKEVGDLIERHIRTSGALIIEYLKRRDDERVKHARRQSPL